MNDSAIETERLSLLAEHLGKIGLNEKKHSSDLPQLGICQNGHPIRFYHKPFFECPHIFKEWTFTSEGIPVLEGISQGDAFESSMHFFNIDSEIFQHCFSPMAQDCERFGGRILRRNSTARDIAHNIKCFLKKSQPNH